MSTARFARIAIAAIPFFLLPDAMAGKAYPVKFIFSVAPGSVPKPGSLSSYGITITSTDANGGPVIPSAIRTLQSKLAVTASGACEFLKLTAGAYAEFRINTTGTCTVAASINAVDTGGNELKGSAQYTFQVPKNDIAFAEFDSKIPATAVVGHDATYLVTSSYNPMKGSPNLTVSSETPSICEVRVFRASGLNVLTSSYTVKALAAGSCKITYATPETDEFRAFSTSKTIAITGGKKQPKITVCDTPTISVGKTGDACFSVDAPLSTTLTSLDTAICTIKDKTITGISNGTCKIRIATTPNDDYDGAVAEQRISILAAASDKTAQLIKFGDAPTLAVGGTANLTVTGGASSNPVTLTSLSTDVCSIDATTVKGVDVGQCVIAANQKGDDSFSDATETLLKFTVTGVGAKGDQAIAFAPEENLAIGSTLTLSALGGKSGNPVTFSSKTPEFCTLSGTTLTAIAEGICIIAADQDGNDQFNSAAQVSKSIAIKPVSKTAQVVSIMDVAPIAVGETATITALGGKSGQPVTLSVLTPATCSLSEATVTATAAGTCTITADQAGTETFAPAAQAKLDIRVTSTSVPFSATISAAGAIEEQTVSATFTPSSDDLGQYGSQFVGAMIGGTVVLLDGINRVDGQPQWVPYTSPATMAAFATGALKAEEITLISNANLSSLAGAKLFLGYGMGADLNAAYENMMLKKTLVEGYEIK